MRVSMRGKATSDNGTLVVFVDLTPRTCMHIQKPGFRYCEVMRSPSSYHPTSKP
jgi:hypothetical protein